QKMLMCRPAEELDAEERAMFEVERLARVGLESAVNLRIAPARHIDGCEIDFRKRVNSLNDRTVTECECRSEHGVPIDEALKCTAEGVDIYGCSDPRGTGHVVRGARGRELMLTPERILADGDREFDNRFAFR